MAKAATIPVVTLLAAMLATPVAMAQSRAVDAPPRFAVDAGWPTVPDGWVLGEVTSIAVDGNDDVWVLHRPRSIPEDQRDRAAPPVLEFDQSGALISSWGGPGEGYDWPEREHGIWVDADGFVWISGNGGWPRPAPGTLNDDFVLKFTSGGDFVMQIGAAGASEGNADTANLHQPADQFVHEAANELYVADGYGNQRVIVFDADSGEFKRMWGAFGNTPQQAAGAAPGPGAPAADPADAPQFGLVHAVKVSDDGIVYVADRGNQRMQWFTTDGEFIDQVVVEGESPPAPAGFAFSPDAEQKYLYVIESANARLMIFERATMTPVGQFGTRSAEPGGMDIAHHIAVDSSGNIYTAEIVNNRRAQRFLAR
jgi:DNA-binding beta-propeller fold protein YncE